MYALLTLGTEEPVLSQEGSPSIEEEEDQTEVKRTDEEIAAAKRAKSKKKQVGFRRDAYSVVF